MCFKLHEPIWLPSDRQTTGMTDFQLRTVDPQHGDRTATIDYVVTSLSTMGCRRREWRCRTLPVMVASETAGSEFN